MSNDWSSVYKKYAGKWVAFSDSERVVGHGKTAREALNQAQKKVTKCPVYTMCRLEV